MKPELPDGDEYEPDDEASLATLIIVDAPQYHNLHSPVDADWLRFTAEEFEDITVETFGIYSISCNEFYLAIYKRVCHLY